jgi:hypothetical protein
MVKRSKTDNEKSTEPSYRVGYRTALAGEANAIAEIPIKICAVEVVKCVCLMSRQKGKQKHFK